MKKWLAYVCVGALALTVTACGNKDNGQGANGSTSVQESTAPAQSVVEESSAPAEIPSDAGISPEEGVSGWSDQMQALKDAITAELGDDYWPSMAMPPELLEMNYGLTPDMYEDYMGELPMMSAHVDTLVIVKAKEGQGDAVESALESYRANLVKNTNQYPMNLGKIQAGKVGRTGDYVYFVLLGGDVMEASEKGDAAVIAHCQEQNDKVMEIISQNVAQ